MIEISIKIKMVFSSKEELKNDSAKFYIKKLAYIHTQSVHLVNVIFIYMYMYVGALHMNSTNPILIYNEMSFTK
jgi:hypothetical protein